MLMAVKMTLVDKMMMLMIDKVLIGDDLMDC